MKSSGLLVLGEFELIDNPRNPSTTTSRPVLPALGDAGDRGGGRPGAAAVRVGVDLACDEDSCCCDDEACWLLLLAVLVLVPNMLVHVKISCPPVSQISHHNALPASSDEYVSLSCIVSS